MIYWAIPFVVMYVLLYTDWFSVWWLLQWCGLTYYGNSLRGALARAMRYEPAETSAAQNVPACSTAAVQYDSSSSRWLNLCCLFKSNRALSCIDRENPFVDLEFSVTPTMQHFSFTSIPWTIARGVVWCSHVVAHALVFSSNAWLSSPFHKSLQNYTNAVMPAKDL